MRNDQDRNSATGEPEREGASQPAEPNRVGRKRDHSRDADILDAVLDVLAEVGFAGLTMDLIAQRAGAGKATVYRRWTSRDQLVLDAVARMKQGLIDLDNLPDTGTLRDDLVALIRPQAADVAERRVRILVGLTTLLGVSPEHAAAVDDVMNRPWVDAYRLLFRRAIERGEIAEPEDIEVVLRLVPSMAAYRVLIERRPVDRPYLVSLIDHLLIPALRPV